MCASGGKHCKTDARLVAANKWLQLTYSVSTTTCSFPKGIYLTVVWRAEPRLAEANPIFARYSKSLGEAKGHS